MNPELSFSFCTNCETHSGKLIDKLQVQIAKLNVVHKILYLSVKTRSFPDSIKRAQVTPLLKKNDPMDMTNYRPGSILTVIKIYKKNYHINKVLILIHFR